MNPYPAYHPSGVEWLGEVPEHWELIKLGRMGSFSKGGGGSKEDEVEDGVPCVRYGDLYTVHQFAVRSTRANISPKSAMRYTRIRYGDLLFAGSGETIEEIGKSAVNLIDDPAYCGGDVILFHPSIDIEAMFLGYAADSSQAVYQKSRMGRGVTVMHIYASELKHLLLAVPPLDEQRTIVALLDCETERIDALVAKMRLLIERLQEYRAALITRTVTRGLPSEAASAAGLDPSPRLKPSGVEWLGDVPEHWEVKPLRSRVSFRGGTTPSKSREEFWDGDIPWVSPKDMKRALIADSEDHVTCAALAESACTMLPVQSVLVVVRGMILAHSIPAAITAAPVTINQDMKGLMTHEPLSHKFLYWFLVGAARALVSLCDESGHGTRKLETATLAGFLTPLPPYGEQAAIAKFLDAQTRRLDELVRRAVSAIERLQECRTALIAAAVTGKVDVREPLAADGS